MTQIIDPMMSANPQLGKDPPMLSYMLMAHITQNPGVAQQVFATRQAHVASSSSGERGKTWSVRFLEENYAGSEKHPPH